MQRVKTKIWDADSIRDLRLKFGISQALFSKVLGTRQQTVSEWELNFYRPKNAYILVLDLIEDELEALWKNLKGNQEEFIRFLQTQYDDLAGKGKASRKKMKSFKEVENGKVFEAKTG